VPERVNLFLASVTTNLCGLQTAIDTCVRHLAEVEGGVEDGRVGEDLRVQKVHQRPELVQVVLQRRARK